MSWVLTFCLKFLCCTNWKLLGATYIFDICAQFPVICFDFFCCRITHNFFSRHSQLGTMTPSWNESFKCVSHICLFCLFWSEIWILKSNLSAIFCLFSLMIIKLGWPTASFLVVEYVYGFAQPLQQKPVRLGPLSVLNNKSTNFSSDLLKICFWQCQYNGLIYFLLKCDNIRNAPCT